VDGWVWNDDRCRNVNYASKMKTDARQRARRAMKDYGYGRASIDLTRLVNKTLD